MALVVALRNVRIIWGALLAAIGGYAFVAFSGILEHPSEPAPPVFFPALSVVAVILGGASFVVPGIVYRQAVARSELAVIREPASEAFSAEYRDAAPTVKVFADPKAALGRAVFTFQTPFILSIAFSEAIAMF